MRGLRVYELALAQERPVEQPLALPASSRRRVVVRAASPLPAVGAGPPDRAAERLEPGMVRRADRDEVRERLGQVGPLVSRLDVVRVEAVGALPAE
jgi:hypothetical protein